MTPNEGQQILVEIAKLRGEFSTAQARADQRMDTFDEKLDQTIALQRQTNGNVTRLKEWRIQVEERLKGLGGQIKAMSDSDSKWSDRRWALFAGATIAFFGAVIGAGLALIV